MKQMEKTSLSNLKKWINQCNTSRTVIIAAVANTFNYPFSVIKRCYLNNFEKLLKFGML